MYSADLYPVTINTSATINDKATAPFPAFPKALRKFGNIRLNECAIIHRIFPIIKSVISSLSFALIKT